MFHGPAAKQKPDYATKAKTRLGVWMLLIYAVIYGGFVGINVIKPVLMERQIAFGLNLAVCYGFALIAIALILALIYNKLCTDMEQKAEAAAPKTGKDDA